MKLDPRLLGDGTHQVQVLATDIDGQATLTPPVAIEDRRASAERQLHTHRRWPRRERAGERPILGRRHIGGERQLRRRLRCSRPHAFSPRLPARRRLRSRRPRTEQPRLPGHDPTAGERPVSPPLPTVPRTVLPLTVALLLASCVRGRGCPPHSGAVGAGRRLRAQSDRLRRTPRRLRSRAAGQGSQRHRHLGQRPVRRVRRGLRRQDRRLQARPRDRRSAGRCRREGRTALDQRNRAVRQLHDQRTAGRRERPELLAGRVRAQHGHPGRRALSRRMGTERRTVPVHDRLGRRRLLPGARIPLRTRRRRILGQVAGLRGKPLRLPGRGALGARRQRATRWCSSPSPRRT